MTTYIGQFISDTVFRTQEGFEIQCLEKPVAAPIGQTVHVESCGRTLRLVRIEPANPGPLYLAARLAPHIEACWDRIGQEFGVETVRPERMVELTTDAGRLADAVGAHAEELKDRLLQACGDYPTFVRTTAQALRARQP